MPRIDLALAAPIVWMPSLGRSASSQAHRELGSFKWRARYTRYLDRVASAAIAPERRSDG